MNIGDKRYYKFRRKAGNTKMSVDAIHMLTILDITVDDQGWTTITTTHNHKGRPGQTHQWSLYALKTKTSEKAPQWTRHTYGEEPSCYHCHVKKGEAHRDTCPWYKAPKA